MNAWCLIFSLMSVAALAPSEGAEAPSQPEDVEPKAFLSAWEDSRYEEACAHLDALKPAQTAYVKATTDVRNLAARARSRCASAAMAQQDLVAAERHILAMGMLGFDDEAVPVKQRLAGWRALGAARQGKLESALAHAKGLPGERWPQGLETALLRCAIDAVRARKLSPAMSTLVMLDTHAPEVFGLDDLRQSLWWATEGGRVAFLIALSAFLLLLALTARSLLRTRRRTKALLQAESGL